MSLQLNRRRGPLARASEPSYSAHRATSVVSSGATADFQLVPGGRDRVHRTATSSARPVAARQVDAESHSPRFLRASPGIVRSPTMTFGSGRCLPRAHIRSQARATNLASRLRRSSSGVAESSERCRILFGGSPRTALRLCRREWPRRRRMSMCPHSASNDGASATSEQCACELVRHRPGDYSSSVIGKEFLAREARRTRRLFKDVEAYIGSR